MVLLLLNSKVPLQSRVAGEIVLNEGQQINLIVKNIGDKHVMLEIMEDNKVVNNEIKALLSQGGTDTVEDGVKIARVLMDNGLPVTKENVEAVINTLKSIKYTARNLEQMGQFHFSEDIDLTKATVQQIARWMLEQESKIVPDDNNGKIISNNKSEQTEELYLLKEELNGVSVQDVVRLIKIGVKPTPFNLNLVKNMREDNGLFKSLLKGIFDYLSINDDGINLDKALQRGVTKDIDLINLSKLLVMVKDNKKTDERIGTTVRVLLEKAHSLSKVLREENLYIIPFLFDKKIQEAIILVDKDKNNGNEKMKDNLTICITTCTNYLGRVEVIVKKEMKNISCNFFVKSGGISDVIKKERKYLADLLDKWEYRLVEYECYIIKKEKVWNKENLFDMWV